MAQTFQSKKNRKRTTFAKEHEIFYFSFSRQTVNSSCCHCRKNICGNLTWLILWFLNKQYVPQWLFCHFHKIFNWYSVEKWFHNIFSWSVLLFWNITCHLPLKSMTMLHCNQTIDSMQPFESSLKSLCFMYLFCVLRGFHSLHSFLYSSSARNFVVIKCL